ncbi:MAG: hypothetical protein JNL74_14190 [Fibrobacteres bacterium]|nr:hypothetical protein [Fibrobacterota bacterium]
MSGFRLLCYSSLFVLFIFSLTCASGKRDTLFVKGTDGKERAVGVYLPKNYSKKKSYPLLVWMHGGVNGTKENRGTEVVSYFIKEADSLGIICAALSGDRSATWFDRVGTSNIRKSIDLIKKKYSIDINRIILGGVSDGGTGCYIASQLFPGEFASFLVLSGSTELPAQIGMHITSAAMKGTPWLIAHGGKDHLYSGEDLKNWVGRKKREGVKISFHYFPDAPHGLDYMPMLHDSLWNFVMRSRR